MSDRFTLHHGDCIEVMRSMPDNSVDSVVTDPPYLISFMGKEWDADDGVAGKPEVWREVLRILKPGGHLLAFGGSRTYHRLAVAIEDAGFEIRDQIQWIYGSGFPKSLDVSKAIDKNAGVTFVAKPASGVGFMNPEGAGGYNITKNQLERQGESTEAAQQWAGWGTALKPAHEPIVVARKPFTGTVAANVLAHGVGALNIDGCRVGSNGESLARPFNEANNTTFGKYEKFGNPVEPSGRWPANVIHDGSDEVVELFSSAARFFYCAKANKRDRNEGLEAFEIKRPDHRTTTGMGSFEEKGVQPQKNHHPCVKPTDLMRYLIRLVTPQGAIILDPFMGSGSTGKAAMYEGVNFIGIEQDAEYLAIAKARIEFALNKPLEDQLFERTEPTNEQLLDQLALPLNEEETA